MSDTLPKIPSRQQDGHKGTFGTVCVLGGQSSPPRVMLGGPAFSALAALRSGVGLAVLAVPEPLMNDALVIAPSATGLALPVDSNGKLLPSEVASILDKYVNSFSCLAIGPGLGAEIPQQQIVVRLIGQEDIPLVIDADGLNALAVLHDFKGDFRAQAVLTPHVGEFRRLAASLGIKKDENDPAQREEAAREMAQRLGSVVVLKSDNTVVTDGVESWINQGSNPALATAGTGDVLTGIIAGLIAQFHKPHLGMGANQITPSQQGGLSLFECAQLGVFIHSEAASRWKASNSDAGMLATDLIEVIPAVITELRTS